MNATANEAVLLISRPGETNAKVARDHLGKTDFIVSTLQFVLRGKLRHDLTGAQIIDHDCTVWNVNSYRLAGLARPSEIGMSVVGYLFLLVFGSLTLAWPVKVKLEMSPLHRWDLETVKKYVNDLIERNPDAYVHETGARIRRLIWTCKSVRCIGAAIMGNPTPNMSNDEQPDAG